MSWGFKNQEFLDPEYVELLPSDLLVPHYLIHSALYYEFDTNIISDEQYDRLAKRLYKSWDQVEHFNKSLIKKKNLKASGFMIKYPIRVLQTARMLIKDFDLPGYLD